MMMRRSMCWGLALFGACPRASWETPPPRAAGGDPPLIPIGVSAKEGRGSVTLSWTPAAGATSYNVYYARSSSVSKTSGTKLAGIVRGPYKVRRLSDRTPYFFVITAVNAAGESGESSWVMAAPRAKAPRSGLARIPAGPFRMGDSLDGTSYALPAHTVDLDEFYIDRYETTYALWKEVYDWAVGARLRLRQSRAERLDPPWRQPARGDGQLVRRGEVAQRPLGEGGTDPRLLRRRRPHRRLSGRGTSTSPPPR